MLALPIAVGVTTHLVTEGVFASIGALNVLLVQLHGDARDRLYRSAWALALNTLLLALGTCVATLGWLEVPLVAIVLTFVHVVNRIPGSENLSLVVSVMFVLGAGLPGASIASAVQRGELAFLGGALALVGLAVHFASLRAVGRPLPARDRATTAVATAGLREWPHAVAVGLTTAAGLGLGLALGLPRDYWVMLTVVVVLRARFRDTLETGVARVVGTVLGAAVAAVVTLALVPASIQGVLMVAFAFLFIAVQRVNYVLVSFGLTVFVILLLNLEFPAGVLLAETRVLDTGIGGGLAIAAAAVLWYAYDRREANAPG